VVISTPYLYAREVLADGGGLLAQFQNPASIADAMLQLLSDPVLMRYHKLVAQRKAAGLSWHKVGQAYARLFERVGRDVALPYGVVQPAVASYLESQRAG
jgi:polysaccharide biosynthesis protein PslF